MNPRAIVVAAVLQSLICMPARPGSQAPNAGALVGTWRLVEYTNFRDGRTVHPFGAEPIGLFIYTPSGHVSVHIMHDPPLKSFGDLDLSSDEQNRSEERSYVGYFGTYRVDSTRSVVIHHVEGGTRLGYIGKDEERPFRLEGDKLIIGDGRTWRRVLVRVPAR